ncbi:iron uptake transporter deferrochelatase/peroxidase subunit [Gryllotalpicola reticulitermitis]|uniref:Deferrochelatase n=1 Tax=Gryllotalpicola reticulitermitis TaxID=1184153 RepID=A0ABV8Q618_9MICO
MTGERKIEIDAETAALAAAAGCPVHFHTPETPQIGRRGFLGGLLGAGAGAAAAAAAAAVAGPALSAQAETKAASGMAEKAGASSYPFHGAHQQGILTPAQRSSVFVAFDATAASRAELQDLFKELTTQARFLATGGTPTDLGPGADESDSGVVGPQVHADGLTVTMSVGASLFDERFGLASAKPAKLTTMKDFPNDTLDRSVCDGDILLQLCADNTDTVVHALRTLTTSTRGAMQPRWRQDGFVSPPRPSGTPRNLMGFKDGTANPKTADTKLMEQLTWVEGGSNGEPAWADGGSYHVVRQIRMLVEFWDRVDLREQENMIGRRRDTGAPQTGTAEFDTPDYVHDSEGTSIRLDAHIRLANPRSAVTASSQFLRRPYNYDNGIDVNGNLDQGLIFAAFNQDLERQFIAVQTRLIDEPLVDYIVPFGGGYFFALPGVKDSSDWYGSGMLA